MSLKEYKFNIWMTHYF